MASILTPTSCFLALLVSGTAIAPVSREVSALTHSTGKPSKSIVLIGASIGRGWNIQDLPARAHFQGYVFKYVGGGGFDKSAKLKEVLGRREDRPDAVILKECAAYFPGDLELYKRLMKSWIDDCLEGGVRPIPATVVPVTRLHSFKKFAIDIAKFRNPLRQGIPFRHRKQSQILEYNDWIRLYCQTRGLAVLDLEKAVRKDEHSRFLSSRLARVDGLHLNQAGYQALDRIVAPVLEDAFR